MRIHHYDPATGRFTGSTEARPDPAEWDAARAAAYQAAQAPVVAQCQAEGAAAEEAYAEAIASLDAALATFRGTDKEGLEEARDAYSQALLDVEAARIQRDARTEEIASQLRASDAAARAAAEAVEPPIWMLPAHATFDAPPEAGDGEQVLFRDGGWVVEPIPTEPEPEPAIPDLAEQAAEARGRRDREVRSVRWMIERHADQVLLGVAPTLSTAEHLQLLQHVEDLRNVPEQPGFPTTIAWPELPEGHPARLNPSQS